MRLTKHFLNQRSKETSDFYVNVREPQTLRRELLLASKSALDILRRLELLQSIREDRRKLQSQLHTVFSELIVLNKNLRAVLPKSIPVVPQSVVVQKPPEEEHVEVPRERSRLQRLESELADIERKLSALE